jgi:hypothetical protein
VCGPSASERRVLAAHGFAVTDTTDYDCDTVGRPHDFPIHVILGAQVGQRFNQRAFFFANGNRYVGTDRDANSWRIEEVWRDGTTIALNYTVYRNADPMCCPMGGTRTVRFTWTGSRVVARDPFPAGSAVR